MDPIPDRNPHATDRSADYPAEPTTLVEFRLAEEAHGTLLTITESGARAHSARALGDSARLRIVGRLCQAGPLSIARLTEGANISRQAITKHLHALSDAGLVRNERTGRESVWRLALVESGEEF